MNTAVTKNNDIPLIRILRYALAVTIVLFFVANVLSNEARAETGTVAYSGTSVFSYTPNTDVGGSSNVPQWVYLYLDSANFTSLQYIIMYANNAGVFTFGLNSESTTFTCVSGCSGSGGYASYVNSSNGIFTWTFNTDVVFTGSKQIQVAYARNIFANVTFGQIEVSRYTDAFPIALGATKPAGVGIQAAGYVMVGKAAGTDFTVETTALTPINYTYNLSYFYAGTTPWFNLAIDKKTSPYSANFHIDLVGSNNVYSPPADSGFNTNDISYIHQYCDGVYINSFAVGGLSRQTAVNTTVISYCGSAPLAPGTGGSISGQVSYNFVNASIGQTYGVNASLADANYSALNTYYIYGTDQNGADIIGFPVSFTTQAFSSGKFWTFGNPGTYNATLKYCAIYECFLGIRHDLDTASVVISPSSISYSITTDKNSYAPGETVTFTINNPSAVKVYFDVFEDTIDVGLGVPSFGLNTEIAAGASNVSISKVIPDNMNLGDYTSYLVSGKLTEETISVLTSKAFNISSPSSTSNTVFLGWDRDSYTLGDTGKLTTVSDYNSTIVYVVSPNEVNKTYLFPSNSTNITMVAFNQIGLWVAKLTNNTGAVLYANTTVYGGAPIGNETFSNCKFSVDYVCWDSTQYEQGEGYRIDYQLTPGFYTISHAFVEITNPSGNIIFTEEINFSRITTKYTGSVYGSFTPQATTGIYYSKLIIKDLFGTNYTKSSSAATVISRTAAVTTTPTTSAKAQEDMSVLLTSSFIWALILTVGLMIAVGIEMRQQKSDALIPMLATGFLSVAAFTWIAWIPAVVFWGMVLLLAIIFAWQRAKDMNTAGE